MATTEQLLELTTRGAIVRMVNDQNGTFFDGSQSSKLVISPPLALGGLRTEVELSIRRAFSASENLPVQGKLAFRFNRLDVANTLEGILDGFRPAMPTSTQVLLNELTRRTGIRFETDDFVLEDIIRSNAAPYVIKAKQESLRWIGEISVTLIDLTDLATYMPPGLPAQRQTLMINSPASSSRNHQPYLNATTVRHLLSDVALGSPVAAAFDPLVTFLNEAVGPLNSFLKGSTPPWRVSATPAPYNLMGAQLISMGELLPGVNALVPDLRLVARVRLGADDTAYSNKDLLIPYGLPSFANSTFNDIPRLRVTAVVNASNGTPWNLWMNSLVAPSVITALPAMDLRFSGPDRWVANPNVPSPTNLYNAVVQYNGSRRPFDIRPYYTECNRVLVLTMSDHNTAYQGNLTFHYRAPIIVDETLPDAILGTPYVFAFNPREGVAPYTLQQASGAPAPGHVLTPEQTLAGTALSTGRFTFAFDVRDAQNTVVRYSMSYRVVIGDMVVIGQPPAGVRGEPYEYMFTVRGGQPDYSYRLIADPALGLSLPNIFIPRVVGNFTGEAGTRTFTLEVTDTVGTVLTHTFSITVS